MNGKSVIDALKKKFRLKTDTALGNKIGMTVQGIYRWKTGTKISTRQFVELVHKATTTSAKHTRASAIRPLVEFFQIKKVLSRGGVKLELFATKSNGGDETEYLDELKRELNQHSGVYVFFDSRGHAIYVGKARKQKLWKEMNLAFNRKRGYIQTIKRVQHPIRNQPYKTANEITRQIKEAAVPLSELAYYFSAYAVDNEMIEELEAMLVRSFANDLLNKRMERFGHQKRKKAA